MTKVNKNLHNERQTYDKAVLNIDNAERNPFIQFDMWYKEAAGLGGFEANAMILSTANAAGHPSSRVVLLKAYSTEGFTFFTNYNSQKGKEMESNPHVSLLFFYEQMQRQIRIVGKVHKITAQASEAYFNTRPIESQYGAMVSNQSHSLESKAKLEEDFKQLLTSHKKPQRPKHWGGYLLIPTYFEFWQGRPSRLHDRVSYTLRENIWNLDLLAP